MDVSRDFVNRNDETIDPFDGSPTPARRPADEEAIAEAKADRRARVEAATAARRERKAALRAAKPAASTDQPTADRDVMRRHLTYLFGGLERHHRWKRGLVEIGTLDDVRFFALTDFEAAATYAAKRVAKGHRVYVHMGLIDPASEKVRAVARGETKGHVSADDVLCWPNVWVDADHKHLGDDKSTAARLAAVVTIATDTPIDTWGWMQSTGTVPSLRVQAFKRLAEPIPASETSRLKRVLQSIAARWKTDSAACNASQVMRLCGGISWAKPDAEPKKEETGLAPRITEPVIALPSLNRDAPRERASFDVLETHLSDTGLLVAETTDGPRANAKDIDDVMSTVKPPKDAPELDREAVREHVRQMVADAAEWSRQKLTDKARREHVLDCARVIGGLLWTGAFEIDEVVDPLPEDEDGVGLSLVAAYEMNGGAADNGDNGLAKGVLDLMKSGALAPLSTIRKPEVTGEGFGAVVDDEEDTRDAATPLAAAWVVYEAGVKAGAAPDGSALLAAADAAGASAVTVAGLRTLVGDIADYIDLGADAEATKALRAIDKTMRKLLVKAEKGETGKGVVVKSAVDFIREYKPMKTRVGKIIRAGYLYTLSGKTGHGKTSFMTALALALALGRADIIGLPVKQCRVVYATFENPDDFRIKLAAACSYHGVDIDALHGRFDVIDASTSPEGMTKAVAAMGDVECVVIDTLQAAFDGKEFNANEEVLRFVRRLRPITRLPGLPTVIVPAHPNKAIDKAEELVPYGGGSIMNEVDGNLTLWCDAAGVLTLSCNKLRGPRFEPLKFKIEAPAFDTIRDDEGDPMSIPVALPITAEEAARDEVQARSVREEVLLVVVAEPEGNTRTWGEKLRCSKTTIANHLKALAADKLVKQDAKGRWTSTLKGEEEAAAIRRRETGGFGPVEDDDEAA